MLLTRIEMGISHRVTIDATAILPIVDKIYFFGEFEGNFLLFLFFKNQ